MKWLRVGIYVGIGALAALLPLIIWSSPTNWLQSWEGILQMAALGAIVGALCAALRSPLWSVVIGALSTFIVFLFSQLVYYLLIIGNLDQPTEAEMSTGVVLGYVSVLIVGLAPAVLARVLRLSDKDNGRRDAAH